MSNQAGRKRRQREQNRLYGQPTPNTGEFSHYFESGGMSGVYGEWKPSTPKYVKWEPEYADRYATVDEVRAELKLTDKEKLHWVVEQSKLYLDWVKQVQEYQRKVIRRAREEDKSTDEVTKYTVQLTKRYFRRHKEQREAAEKAYIEHKIPEALKDTSDWRWKIDAISIPKED